MLNAFRHHRVGRPTQRRRGEERIHSGAQRLSASQGGTDVNMLVQHGIAAGCSTPFGITGWDGSAEMDREDAAKACSTPFGITGWDGSRLWLTPTALTCAQRLSASQGGTAATASSTSTIPIGAQRLSASQGGTVDGQERPSLTHQVLNAFRHHRVGRDRRSRIALPSLWCSTPFGITGWDGACG